MASPFCRYPVFVFCFLLSLSCAAQKTPTPSTLLWRITGKGLQQPSYLYGTMHLQDKRLFQFGDSVYHAIESTAGLATEIDFKAYFDSVIHRGAREAEAEILLSRQKLTLNRKKLNPTADSLLKRFGIKGNTVTKKDLKKIRDYRLRKYLADGEMPTMVDGFLMGLALRQGKWTGGIEDVEDQLNIKDELGGELAPETVLQPEKNMRQGIEEMIKIYTAQNLDEIEKWSSGEFGPNARDRILLQRNVKMAYRMDSLSTERPTFFAVGAAHLPGDSGVIALLQQRGFSVVPVYSSRTVSGELYATKLQKASWKDITGEEESYTVQMPGAASEIQLFGNITKMKICFDLTSMTFYFTGFAQGYNQEQQPLETALQKMAENMGLKKSRLTVQNINSGSLQGKETFFTNDGAYFRLQLFLKNKFLFLVMAGSPKKAMLTADDANHFFSSFRPGKTEIKNEWTNFSLPEKAFSVRMPGSPVINTAIDDKIPAGADWAFTSYHSIDPGSGAYYLMQVRQAKEGLNLLNDSSYLQAVAEEFRGRLDKITRLDTGRYHGYPALFMNYHHKEANADYKSLHLVRGNRVYVLIGGVTRGGNISDIDTFLESFKLLPYEKAAWQAETAPGFTTWAPSTFRLVPPDSTAKSKEFTATYRSFNKQDLVSYEVFKEQLPSLYWAKNDSSFLQAKVEQYRTIGDSLLYQQWNQHGRLKALSFAIQAPGSETQKHLRILVNGDTLYTLHSMVQARDWNGENQGRFFSSFRLQQEAMPTIYSSKATQLLQALATTDSAALSEATGLLDLIQFQKEELPLLHRSLLQVYADYDAYDNISDKLLSHIIPFADSTTLSFITKEYPGLSNEQERIKFPMLSLLGNMKTPAAYAVLQKLLLLPLPRAGNAFLLQAALADSLPLTATLFPALLQLAGDSLLAPVLVTLTNQLLDSNLLDKTALLPYETQLLQITRHTAANLQKGEAEPWELTKYVTLLGSLNTSGANALLKELLPQPATYLKQAVILALVKNNIPVAAAEMKKVAADKEQRIYFYEALKELHKEALFPAGYAMQQSFAESELYNFIADDYEDNFTLTYIGQRNTLYKGKNGIFHLFKLRMAYEEDGVKRDYLAVTGPYTQGAKEKLTATDAAGFYTEQVFHPQKIDQLLKAYLKNNTPAEK